MLETRGNALPLDLRAELGRSLCALGRFDEAEPLARARPRTRQRAGHRDAGAVAAGAGARARPPRRARRGRGARPRGGRDRRGDRLGSTSRATRSATSPRCSPPPAAPTRPPRRSSRRSSATSARAASGRRGGAHGRPARSSLGWPCRNPLKSTETSHANSTDMTAAARGQRVFGPGGLDSAGGDLPLLRQGASRRGFPFCPFCTAP